MSALDPLAMFNFAVTFTPVTAGSDGDGGRDAAIGQGAFSEITGLEAMMEPKVIKEGGRNYGPVQRAGQVSFSTVVMKRGVCRDPSVWRWFFAVASGAYARRYTITVTLMAPPDRTPTLAWKLHEAMPIKIKTADLNAQSTAIGIEELHLAHEGLEVVPPAQAGGARP